MVHCKLLASKIRFSISLDVFINVSSISNSFKMENIIHGPGISEETNLNMQLGLAEYLLKVTKNHLDKVLMVSDNSM